MRRQRVGHSPPYQFRPGDRAPFGNFIQQLEVFFRNVDQSAHKTSVDIQKIYPLETKKDIAKDI
jgi:hypothetical protein